MKYEVSAKFIEFYLVEVEADSKEEAIELADAMLEGDAKHSHHWDSDAEFTAYTQEEL